MSTRNPEVLLFDLGAVLIDISFDVVFDTWGKSARETADMLRASYEMDATYEAHERGELHAEQYWQALRKSLDIDLTDDEFVSGWNAIFQGEITAVTGLLSQLQLPLYVFSNTNRTHQDCFEATYGEALSPFRHVFTSNDLGERKPDAAAFLKVAGEIGAEPGAILFFDDSAKNIKGANQVGIQTCHVTEPGVVRTELARRGLL